MIPSEGIKNQYMPHRITQNIIAEKQSVAHYKVKGFSQRRLNSFRRGGSIWRLTGRSWKLILYVKKRQNSQNKRTHTKESWKAGRMIPSASPNDIWKVSSRTWWKWTQRWLMIESAVTGFGFLIGSRSVPSIVTGSVRTKSGHQRLFPNCVYTTGVSALNLIIWF